MEPLDAAHDLPQTRLTAARLGSSMAFQSFLLRSQTGLLPVTTPKAFYRSVVMTATYAAILRALVERRALLGARDGYVARAIELRSTAMGLRLDAEAALLRSNRLLDENAELRRVSRKSI